MSIPPSRKEAAPGHFDVHFGERISRSRSLLYDRDHVEVGTRTRYQIPRKPGVPITAIVPFSKTEISQLGEIRDVYLDAFPGSGARRNVLSKASDIARFATAANDPFLTLDRQEVSLVEARLGEVYVMESPEMYEFVIDMASRKFISDTYFHNETVENVPGQYLPASHTPTPGRYTMKNLRSFTLNLHLRPNLRFIELPRENVNDVRTQAEGTQLLIRILAKEGLFPLDNGGQPLLNIP